MRIFFTKASFQRAIDAATATEPDASDLMLRYSENPTLLKRAWAAMHNSSVEALDKRNVSESDILLTPIKRAVRAYAAGLKEMREGLS